MTERKRSRKRKRADDEVLASGGEYPPCLRGLSEVSATCVALDVYPNYGRENLCLYFAVFDPPEYERVILACHAAIRPKWLKTGLPTGSKLMKMIVIASGKRKVRKVTRKSLKSIFLGKAYRCRVRETCKDAPYSIVDTPLEVLAG